MIPEMRPARLFADTSFFYAALDPEDASHPTARKTVEWIAITNTRIVTTWEVIVETVTLLRNRYSYAAAIGFIQKTLPTVQLINITQSDREESLQLFKKLASDKELSLCDVISYLVVKKYLRHAPCLAFDDDFWTLGLTPFQLPQ